MGNRNYRACRGGLLELRQRFGGVFRHALAGKIELAEIQRANRIAGDGRPLIELAGLFVVFGNAVTVMVDYAEPHHGGAMALGNRLLIGAPRLLGLSLGLVYPS